MPSVLPCSSTPSHRERFHCPAWRSRVGLRDVARLREQQRDRVLGRRRARSTAARSPPSRRAGSPSSTSTLSSPMPARPTTTRSVAGREHLGGDLGRAADHERRGARAPRRAARSGESPSRTSTSSPAARIASSPLSASCSVTRTRLHHSRLDADALGTRHVDRPDRCPGARRCAARPRRGRRRRARTTGGRSRARRTPRRARSRPSPRRAAPRTARASTCGVRPAISRPSTPSNDGKQ